MFTACTIKSKRKALAALHHKKVSDLSGRLQHQFVKSFSAKTDRKEQLHGLVRKRKNKFYKITGKKKKISASSKQAKRSSHN